MSVDQGGGALPVFCECFYPRDHTIDHRLYYKDVGLGADGSIIRAGYDVYVLAFARDEGDCAIQWVARWVDMDDGPPRAWMYHSDRRFLPSELIGLRGCAATGVEKVQRSWRQFYCARLAKR